MHNRERLFCARRGNSDLSDRSQGGDQPIADARTDGLVYDDRVMDPVAAEQAGK